ncbi:hypothetical protein DSO57_1003918 [Entomophthora muscae]|uniref:Uncharacterized protein n=1 Tax=Entomophthora muscae TaxID=34485 RepID=A0ACC2SB07_9FUNG|nr:hypothetical protein DSO57_1003918 [Entomophthora muscae]
MQNCFETIYLAHERPSRVTGYRQAQHNAPFTGNCYNCNKQGHKSERCTSPCSICKGTNHSNYSCAHRICTNVQRPIAVMMSEQFYQTEKHPLSTPKGVSPLNKKTNSDYIIDHNGPALSPLIKPRYIRSCAPSPDQDYTPPPLKRHEREADPSPKELLIDSEGPTTTESQATAELIDKVYKEGTHAPPTTPSAPTSPSTVCDSRWNPEHPNPFTPLKEQLDFDNPLLAEEDPRYNLVTVETVPESPTTQAYTNNSIDLNLEIPFEFPTGDNSLNTSSMAANATNRMTHTEDNYMESDSVYNKTPMETSPLVEVDATNNPPMETSPLVGTGLAVNPHVDTTTPLESEVNCNSPMDTFNTPTDKELVDYYKSDLSMNTGELKMNDNYKPVVPGISKQSSEADTLKLEKLNKGISIDKLFEDTSITISLADLF